MIKFSSEAVWTRRFIFPEFLNYEFNLFIGYSTIQIICFILFFLRNFFICLLILQREEGGVRDRERGRNIYVRERISNLLPPVCTPIRDQTYNQSKCSSQRWNSQPIGVRDRVPNNWASQPGLICFILIEFG